MSAPEPVAAEGTAREAPVVIGATGGSGTRVFAVACEAAGYYFGTRLNEAHDAKAFVDFYERWIDTFLEREAKPLTERHARKMDTHFRKCVDRHRAGLSDASARWGWKNPRSMLVLPFLHGHYPAMRFVHVVRDGRDMAYSSNRNQPKKHGRSLFGEAAAAMSRPELAMRVWSRTNLDVADFGERHLGPRYRRMRFEDLCADPRGTLQSLLAFLDVADVDPAPLAAQVRVPGSLGRWRTAPSDEQARLAQVGGAALERFGYV